MVNGSDSGSDDNVPCVDRMESTGWHTHTPLGHGMLYTEFADAMIWSIEMPTFIRPRGAMDRTTNRMPNRAAMANGTPNDATRAAPFATAGHGEHRPYSRKYPAEHTVHKTPL